MSNPCISFFPLFVLNDKKEVRLKDQVGLPNKMTQNNVYVGSSTDLQRMLLKKMEDANVIESEE